MNLKFKKSFFCKILKYYLNFLAKFKKLNFYLSFYGFFNTSLFIWYISIHHVKYLDKPIKCLEMRAKIKSVRKINEIFFVFSPIFENRTFFPHSSMLTKNICWDTCFRRSTNVRVENFRGSKFSWYNNFWGSNIFCDNTCWGSKYALEILEQPHIMDPATP